LVRGVYTQRKTITLGILAYSSIEECKDGSSRLVAIPLISISKQEKRNGIFIQTANFPNAVALPI
jgi:hypothetical protein